ncbi:hypothetical protein ACT691_05900 [Vibrio metschnikovii]
MRNLHSTLRMYEQQANRFEQVLKDNQAYLYNNPDHPSFGAQDPELTLVFSPITAARGVKTRSGIA